MRMFIGEVFDPIRDFYKMRKGKEISILIVIPILLMLGVFVLSLILKNRNTESVYVLCDDFLNQLLTILALFISFSMAYLSIIISSSSENVTDLKAKESEVYSIDGKPCTLYQVLSVDLTYTLVIQVFFLAMVLFQKFLICVCSDIVIKGVIALNVAGMAHILIMMLVVVKSIYFTFWRSK